MFHMKTNLGSLASSCHQCAPTAWLNGLVQFFKEIYDHLINSEGMGRKETDIIPLEMVIVNTLGYLVYLNIFFAITFT